MWIFFCFCDADLLQSLLLQHFAQCILQVIILEDNMNVFERVIILRHRCIVQVQLLHIEVGEIDLREHLRDLPATICTEVETKRHIIIFNGS